MTCRHSVSIDVPTGKYTEDTFKAFASSPSKPDLTQIPFAEVIVAAMVSETISSILSNLSGGANRACVMGIINATDKPLIYKDKYLWSGQVTKEAPHEIPPGHGAVPTFQHTASTARGSVGVLGYYYGHNGPLIAILWSVPFTGTSYMNVRIYPTDTPVDYDMAYSMYWETSDTGVPNSSKCAAAGDDALVTKDAGFNIQSVLTANNDARMNVWIARR